jgi:hypothetical protein
MTEHAQEAQDNPVTPPGQMHPEKYQADMNPHAMAGGNWGLEGPHPEKECRTAADMKELYECLPRLTADELRRIPVLPPGSRLEQGATYIDLRQPHLQEFTAIAGMEAGEHNWYVPKSEVEYQVWNELIGVNNPERIGQASEA